MPQWLTSALADSVGGWDADTAYRYVAKLRVRTADLLDVQKSLEGGLFPVRQDWLAWRLQQLWKSSPHAASLSADSWLMETGRLLADIPGDILAHAFDEAVKRAERGFMPTVGEIRAIADPLFLNREKQLRRIRAVIDEKRAAQRRREEAERVPVDVCSGPAASAIMAEYGLARVEEPKPRFTEPPRNPTVDDYVSMGVAADAALRYVEEAARAAGAMQ